MANWRIWVRDMRTRHLPKSEAKRVVTLALGTREIAVTSGPMVLVPPSRYPGEWVFTISDPYDVNGSWAKLKVNEALKGTNFELRCAPFPMPRPRLRPA